MKRITAAIAVLALTLLPGAILAGEKPGWIVAIDYDSDAGVVIGATKFWTVLKVRNVDTTKRKFIDNPELFPAGVCRSVAIRWNMYTSQDRSRVWFDSLLERGAKHHCALSFVRDDVANADGSFDLIEVSPSP